MTGAVRPLTETGRRLLAERLTGVAGKPAVAMDCRLSRAGKHSAGDRSGVELPVAGIQSGDDSAGAGRDSTRRSAFRCTTDGALPSGVIAERLLDTEMQTMSHQAADRADFGTVFRGAHDLAPVEPLPVEQFVGRLLGRALQPADNRLRAGRVDERRQFAGQERNPLEYVGDSVDQPLPDFLAQQPGSSQGRELHQRPFRAGERGPCELGRHHRQSDFEPVLGFLDLSSVIMQPGTQLLVLRDLIRHIRAQCLELFLHSVAGVAGADRPRQRPQRAVDIRQLALQLVGNVVEALFHQLQQPRVGVRPGYADQPG
ncbi:hypothetical protein [Nocardia sp. GP40]|uniref:hypothetical protein n=1 Tax=Nocardia sp. GP40 TaxID=3156268 RepID=UPI003D1A9DD6